MSTCRRQLTHAVFLLLAATPAVLAQSTAFTYQGELKNAGSPASGLHDIRFKLFDSASGGAQVGSTVCVNNAQVTNGTFTATIDFGTQLSNISARHLEIEVRTDTGLDCANTTGYTTLSPRQPITPAPRSIAANTAFSLSAPDGSPQSSLMVDNSGNVGLGTTLPQVPLHIKADGQGIKLEGLSTGVNNSAYLAFANGAGTDLGYIGDGSSGDNSMYLTSYTGNVNLYTAAGAALSAAPSGNVGVGTPTPAAKLDVRGSIRLGSSGQYFAPGGEENLRIIRGSVNAAGQILRGSGFTVDHLASGSYRINFTAAFADIPTVTATASRDGVPAPMHVIMTDGTLTGSVNLIINNSFQLTDRAFSFIAIGPR